MREPSSVVVDAVDVVVAGCRTGCGIYMVTAEVHRHDENRTEEHPF